MSQIKRSQKEKQEKPQSIDDLNFDRRTVTRSASVYDAVAGRVGSSGLKEGTINSIRSRNGFPCIESPFTPLEVLLRRESAPTAGRADVYFADENLEVDQKLPDSELLKVLHAYSSDFYSMQTEDRGQCDFRSLDETALIALGVLLEEAAIQALGETGDTVLVEPEGADSIVAESRATQMQISGRVPQVQTPPYVSEESSDDSDAEEMRARKRRRHGDDRMD